MAENKGPRFAWGGSIGVHIAIVCLVLLGGVLLPIVGWVVGVGLLWVVPGWRVRDKLIGTLVPPGGLLPLFVLLDTNGSFTPGCFTPWAWPGRLFLDSCTPGGWQLPVFPTALLIGVLLLCPIGCAIHLLTQSSAGRQSPSRHPAVSSADCRRAS
jgi:hypothetical protein